MAEPPATRAKGKRKTDDPDAIPSIEEPSSSIAGSRPTSSHQSRDFDFGHQSDTRDPSEDPSSHRSTRSKKRKLDGLSQSVTSSISGDSQKSIEINSAHPSRAASEVTGVKTRSNSSRDNSRSMSSSQNPVLTPAGEQLESENTETPAIADTPPENAGDESGPDVQPMRRGRPPNRGRGRGRGGRGGRGGLTRTNSSIKPKKTNSGRGRGGRGGRGKKTSSIRRVQAAYDRQKDLRSAFRTVAKAVKDGLEVLAEKNLKVMQDEPDFYKKQPQYDKVLDELDTIQEQVQQKIDAKAQWELMRVQNRKEMNDAYVNAVFQVCRVFDFNKQILTLLLVTNRRPPRRSHGQN